MNPDSDSIKDGETYAIVTSSGTARKGQKKRQGNGFFVLGEIQMTGRQDNLWVGQITQARAFIERGALFVPRLPRIKQMDPVPAPRVGRRYFLSRSSIFDLRHGPAWLWFRESGL